MFTGLIEAVGEVRAVRPSDGGGLRLTVTPGAAAVGDGTVPGDSVAVDGCCLTAVEISAGAVTFDAVPETVRRSTLKTLRVGDKVNLERALPANGRLGGHFVQGHVDCTATVRRTVPAGTGLELHVQADNQAAAAQIVEKGSVALAGVSLTVAGLEPAAPGGFWTAVIPETLRRTTLGTLRPGDKLNLETDILAKYVQASLSARPGDRPADRSGASSLTVERLRELGF